VIENNRLHPGFVTGERVIPWLVPLLFAILGAVLYANSLEVPFVYDDTQNIVINKAVHLEELSWAGLKEAAVSEKPTRAVAFITFALNYYFGGEQVAGYHIVNILIHVINASLVFWLVRLTLQLPALGYTARDASLIAFFTALLWLVNPVQTQTVTYIVQRWNSLAVMFYLAALLMYIHARLALSGLRRWLLFTGCALSGVLGFLTKEITAVLPFFILLYELFFFQDLGRARRWRNLVLTALVVLVFGVVAYLYMGHWSFYQSLLSLELPEYTDRWFTLNERLLTEPRVVLFYLGLLLFPAPSRLNLDHDFPLSYTLWDPLTTFFAIAALVTLVVLAVSIARRQRLLAFCILWYLGHLVIESSVIGLEIIYEHRSYLPSIGVFLLLVVLAFRTGLPQRVLAIGFCLLAVVWSVWTIERNALWADPVAFWLDVVEKSPGILRSYHALGILHINNDQHAEAEAWFTRAIAVHDQFKKTSRSAAQPSKLTTLDWIQARSYYRRGTLLLERGALPEANQDFSAGIRIAGRKLPRAYLYRGFVNHEQENYKAALKDYSSMIKYLPDYYVAWEYRGDLYLTLKDYTRAASDYLTLTELNPDDPDAYRKLGKVLMADRQYKAAQQALETSLEVAPADWKWRDDVELILFLISLRKTPDEAP
jgi:Tfp pilus assembly protein PilF